MYPSVSPRTGGKMTNKDRSPRSGRQNVAPGEAANRGNDQQRPEPRSGRENVAPGESANRGKDDQQRPEPAERGRERYPSVSPRTGGKMTNKDRSPRSGRQNVAAGEAAHRGEDDKPEPEP